MPLWSNISYPDTEEAQERLKRTAGQYNKKLMRHARLTGQDMEFIHSLIAHGLGGGLQNLLDIIQSGCFKGTRGKMHFGALSALGEPAHSMGVGAYDNGWGVLVIDRTQVIQREDTVGRGEQYMVPLTDFYSIVFPRQVAEVIREILPKNIPLPPIQSYEELAEQIEKKPIE